jgi:putative transcriptional regulator
MDMMLKGQLLIATTELLDPNFVRTVILVIEHTENGAHGLVLNRPTDALVTDIAEQVFREPFEWAKPIHLGGPVPGPVTILHTCAERADLEILAGVYSSIDASKLQQLLRQRTEPAVIVANYAGWGAGQLEAEIEEGSWLAVQASAAHVFRPAESDLWAELFKEASAATLAEMLKLRALPADPRWN